MNFRKLPHPHYGNYGGRTNKGCIDNQCLPIDEMDTFFKIHDIDLKDSKGNKYLKYLADSTLFLNLTEVDLREIKIPIYGHLYWLGSILIFGTIHYFFKPDENER